MRSTEPVTHLAPAPAHALGPECLGLAELRTLSFVAGGLSDSEICETTGLPVATVEDHLRAARVAAGLERRCDLVAWALDHRPRH